MATFAQKLLRIYDRKLLSGEITFSQSGIRKDDFTRLCIDPEFVLAKEDLEIVCEKMGIFGSEKDELMSYVS